MNKNEIIFHKYEHLATSYANRVFNESLIGYDREDLQQEFRIKLYEIILAYRRSIVTRVKQGRVKPMPLPIYISGAMNNFKKDFIAKIKKKEKTFVKNELASNKDYAIFNKNSSIIDFKKNLFVINGLDITKPLEGAAKAAFILHLKGTNMADIERSLGKVVNVKKVIKDHKEYLKSNKELFEIENNEEIFVNYIQEE